MSASLPAALAADGEARLAAVKRSVTSARHEVNRLFNRIDQATAWYPSVSSGPPDAHTALNVSRTIAELANELAQLEALARVWVRAAATEPEP